jgi:dienelactone hydrolase
VGLETTWPENTRAYSDNVLKWIQDFRRTIDYVETREDFDISRLGYFGWSWGGWNGPIVMALDDRIKAGVYVSGGIPPTLARPEASSASFASRVSAPVLMISGRHDVLRPVETFQKPMFESLGTPAALKRHAILEGGHAPPMNQLVRETLTWFDTYLGTVD